MKKAILLAISLTLVAAEVLRAAEALPQTLPYQQQLRRFMATLKSEDFPPVHKDLKVVQFAGERRQPRGSEKSQSRLPDRVRDKVEDHGCGFTSENDILNQVGITD